MLVTNEYRLQLQAMHEPDENGRVWGATACRRVYEITDKIQQARGETLYPTSKCTVLDYGSSDGKFKEQVERRQLLKGFPPITNYDPGVPEYAENNTPHWMVVCIDVLEHVEPELIDDVLKDIRQCMSHKGLFHIAMYPANQLLPDGRNAHLIVERPEWWLEKLRGLFNIKEHRVFGPDNAKTLEVFI